MSDFDDEGRRIPDEDEREDAINERRGTRIVCCPQCDRECGKWYPASAQTWECPGEPASVDEYEGSIVCDDQLFCSAECVRIYTEE